MHQPDAGALAPPPGSAILTAAPSISISPPSGCSTPPTMFISVDLPAPFSPISACTSPARSSKDTPVSARTAPKRLVMPVSLRSGVDMALPSALARRHCVLMPAGTVPAGSLS